MPSNYVYIGSGGISVGGPQHYTLDVDYEAVSGGLVFGGSAVCEVGIVSSSYVYVGSGGISVGGLNDDLTDYAYCSDNFYPISLGGSADCTNSNIVDGQTNYVYVGSGGISLSSPSYFLLDYAYCSVNGTPITIGGSAQSAFDGIVTTANFTCMATGGITVSGAAAETFAKYVYNMSGGITMGGVAELDNEIYIDILLGWDTDAIVVVDILLGWNTGSTPTYFYRVEGVCEPLACPPIADPDPANSNCTYSFIQNIAATNVCDVCTQLANSRFLKTILTIKQFSNPALESDIQSSEALGKIDPSCNNLTTIDFCQCPSCAQFCDYEGETKGEITTTTTQTISVVDGFNITYQLVQIRNRSGEIIEEYNIPVYTPEYETLITKKTSTNFGYSILTTGRITMGGEAVVSWKPTEIPLVATSGTVITSCGCNVPVEIYLTTDLPKTNKLGNFLTKNAFTLLKTNTLIYSLPNQAWFKNISFVGTGLDGVSQERWSVIFRLECTNVVDGIYDPSNSFFWKLTILVRQQVIGQNKIADTRIQVNMTDGGPCEQGQLSVSAYFNVSTNAVTPLDPSGIAISASFVDKIGLFQGPAWVSNPKFFIGLTVDEVTSTADNIQFGPIYPQLEVSRLN